MSGVGKLVIVSAPSGTGKTTLIRKVRELLPNLHFSVSATTRPKREVEEDGKDYHFLADDEFDRLIREGQLLEWATVHTRKYGTLRRETERLLREGTDVIFDIDIQGAEQILATVWEDVAEPEIVTVFIYPPNLDSLRERLLHRPGGTNNIEVRLGAAEKEMEVGRRLYANSIINQDGDEGIENAVLEFIEILRFNGID